MKYSYEYKRMCVELYRQGKWPETPEGKQKMDFHQMIRKWVRMEDSCGPETLRHKNQNKEWTAEQRYELVAQVLAGRSVKETAFSAGINDGQLHQWVKRYKMEGYQGFGRKAKRAATQGASNEEENRTSRVDTVRAGRNDSAQGQD